MENKIGSIFVLELGWIYVDNRDYSRVEIKARENGSCVFQIFDRDGNLKREIDGKFVIAIDYER